MDLIEQEFRVSLRYPVYFTRRIFAPENQVLRFVLAPAKSEQLADLVVVADAGVVKAHPGLVESIEAYARTHDDVMRLTAPVLVVPGGEEVKNDPRHLEEILRRIHEGALCRH